MARKSKSGMSKTRAAGALAAKLQGRRAGEARRGPARKTASGHKALTADIRSAKSATRRDAILQAALEEFSAQGFTAARLDDVAKRAGIAKGTIYLYFRDKETLFQEIIRATMVPFATSLEDLRVVEGPVRLLAEQLIELFMREIFETSRKDVIRLMISEGSRFPKLAEFYYREVLSRIVVAVRALVSRGIERGEISNKALLNFPQVIGAPGIMAIIWSGLFDRFEPLDVRAMMRVQLDLVFTKGSAS